jgi:hypothetical protein
MSADSQIRRTIAQFGQYLDERRFAEWAALFTEDAAFQHLTGGRAEIQAHMETEELARLPELYRKHAAVNPIIDIGNGAAHAETDLVLYERLGAGPWILRMGKYTDDLVPGPDGPDGPWLFANRQLAWTANGLDRWQAGEGDQA